MNKPATTNKPTETPADTAAREFEDVVDVVDDAEIDVVDEEEAEETEQIKAELKDKE